MQSGILIKSYTATGLTIGLTYNFKVQARNLFGLSASSTSLSLLAAFVPSQPIAPTTLVVGSNVQITWAAPFNGGSSITSYKVFVRETNVNQFAQDTTHCDGALASIVSAAQCLIPISALTAAPF